MGTHEEDMQWLREIIAEVEQKQDEFTKAVTVSPARNALRLATLVLVISGVTLTSWGLGASPEWAARLSLGAFGLLVLSIPLLRAFGHGIITTQAETARAAAMAKLRDLEAKQRRAGGGS